MILPILLLIGKQKEAIVKMMFFLKEQNPSEHQIIQKALSLDAAGVIWHEDSLSSL